MTCSNIGKKDLVDRKIKVEVSGKGREIWRVKKEWHGIRVQEKDKTLQGGWVGQRQDIRTKNGTLLRLAKGLHWE